MEQMLANLAAGVADVQSAPRLLAGTGADDVHLLVVATADPQARPSARGRYFARFARNRLAAAYLADSRPYPVIVASAAPDAAR